MKGAMLAAVFAAAMTLAGCGLQQDLGSVPIAGNGPVGPATPISAPTLTGSQFSWSSTHGHVVVLDFWGSWCGPCNKEQPDLNKLAAQWMPKGVIFLGVDELDPVANGAAYERAYKVPYASVNDANELITSEYNVIDPPTLIVIDARGDIVDRFLGTLAGISSDLSKLT